MPRPAERGRPASARRAALPPAQQRVLIAQGARILAGYKHPGDWEDGDVTGRSTLMGTIVLKVTEIQLGSTAVPADRARDNAAAIKAWASRAGIRRYQLRVEQVQRRASYVVVTREHERYVMEILRGLRAQK